MQVTVLHPLSLLLLAAVPALWLWPRRLQDWRQGVIRSLLFVLLTLALAQPVWLRPATDTCQVIIIDRSASLSAAQRRAGEELLSRLQKQVSPRDRLTVVEFGSDAPAGERGGDEPANRQDIRLVDESSSSFSGALTAGLRGIPRGCQGVVTLIGDGLATDRHWGRPLQQLQERGIVVAVHDLAQRRHDVFPAGIVTQPSLRVGSTAHVSVTIVGVGSGMRIVLRDAQGELVRSAALDSNGHLSVTLEFEPRVAGYAPLTAAVVVPADQDDDPTNNVLSTTIAVQDALRILYLGGRQKNGAQRVAQLLGDGFDVEEPDAPLDEHFPLHRYDLVMLDDRPVERLPVMFQRRLLARIQHEGLGAFVSGGRAAFGSGGYARSILAAALPVELLQREAQRDPSVALAIILDSSGSMAGLQLELGKQVARLATRRLQPHDEIGIVEFYGAKSWAVPLQSARNRIEVDRAIGRIQADGSTVLYPAIEEAYYGLKKSQARYKHIVMITDAGVEDAGFEKLIRRVAADGVAVSTVLVGPEAYSPLLADMARWGGGKYYSVTDRFNLVELDFREPASERMPAYRQGMFGLQSQGGVGWWGTTGRLQPPPLRGYAETKARKQTEVLLATQSGAHPVLSSWHFGLGRVTAFMSEPMGEGTANWRQWPEYGAMLGRVLARTASDYEPFGFEWVREDYQATLRARRYSSDASLQPRAVSEEGSEELQFRQVAADLFEAVEIVDPRKELRVVASIASARDGGFSRRLVSPALEDVSPETQVDPQRALDLKALARVSGGSLIDKDAPRLPLASQRQPESFSLAPLSPWLLLLALLNYLGELFYRRNVGRIGAVRLA